MTLWMGYIWKWDMKRFVTSFMAPLLKVDRNYRFAFFPIQFIPFKQFIKPNINMPKTIPQIPKD